MYIKSIFNYKVKPFDDVLYDVITEWYADSTKPGVLSYNELIEVRDEAIKRWTNGAISCIMDTYHLSESYATSLVDAAKAIYLSQDLPNKLQLDGILKVLLWDLVEYCYTYDNNFTPFEKT